MKPYSIVMAAALLCGTVTLSAQEKCPVKFGKVSPEDFVIKQVYDSSADAVVIADVGNSVFEGNMKGWFSLVFKRKTRIKILNVKGFEAADIRIGLYINGTAEEKLDDLKATTYNLENGKVVETKLDAANLFKDKLDANNIIRKFTFPAIKEGSIVEYSYTVKSDFLYNLQPWVFQREYPCLWSEYEVGIPEYFNYVTLNQGFLPMDVKSSVYQNSYRVTLPGGAGRDELVTLDGSVNSRRWVVKNAPALKQENFTSSLKNYISGVEFQLSSYQIKTGPFHDMMGNWLLMGQKLMENEYFGAPLTKNNNWLDDDLKLVTKDAVTKLEKAKKIFAYVRDNLTCTDHSAFYIETNLKDAFKKHNGSVADINLLLTAMLRHEDILADPVILSTKSHGFTNEIYPLLSRFNYVVCHAEVDGKLYELDASSPYSGFGRLSPDCYNGHARVITKAAAMPLYFEADSLKEQKMTSVFIGNDEKEGLVGSFKSQLGYYESFGLREKLKGDAGGYFKKIKTQYSFDINITEAAIDSLKQPDNPALVHYEFAFKPAAEENIFYFNPMMTEGYKENPFASASRQYPVEMPYTTDETYLFNMEIPKGYTVEEIPKSAKVAFNEDEGFFEYLVQKSADAIMMRCRIKLSKATFNPEDYEGLREFFAFIVKKQGEQIVLKKK
jgi:hypothetical protein